MTFLLIVLAFGVVAAVAAFLVSASPSIAIDPIDPTAEEQAIKRSIRHHPKVRRFLRQRMDRQSAGGFMLTAAFLIVVAAASALGVLLALIDRSEWMREIDDAVAEWGSDHATTQAVDVIRVVTNLGTTWVVLLVLLVVATADFVRRRNKEVFLFVAAVGVGELILNNLVKVLIQRDRPDVLHVMTAHGYSFPSGHTAAAAAGWSAVALVLGRGRSPRVRAVLAGGAALIAVIVATSRALLGVHWVSDVLGGLALGWGWFLLVAVIFGGRAQRLGDPVVETPAPEVAPVKKRRDRVDA
jgi:membrane-associated phospholipid phosphatase